ncbi:MAG: homoserine kinase [Chloroflexi bacterium]|nr:homoserine kinase [Chloroflexota bacterium]
MTKKVTVTIPATTANLGPGFDCLGMALSLYNHVTFTAVSTPTHHITVTGVDADKVATDQTNLVAKSAEILFERVGKRPSGYTIHQQNNIPVGSGLGSSSTAILAGIFGANALIGNPHTRAQLLDIATELEGHPDNVAPAVYGGLVLGVQHQNQLHIEQFNTPPIQVAIILPDFHLLTSAARAALPSKISFNDAIHNIGRIGLLIRALETAAYDKLAIAMQDKLHQPYRIPLIPGMEAAFTAAYQAGAKGVAISGAGPSIIVFAPKNLQTIANAAAAAFAQAGLKNRTWILTIDTKGCQVNEV